MFRKSLAVFTMMGISLLLVNVDSYRGFNRDRSYATENNYQTNDTLTSDNELKLEMTATTDKPTPVNLVNHSYWNLAGHARGNILGQYLTINADRYTPSNEQRVVLANW